MKNKALYILIGLLFTCVLGCGEDVKPGERRRVIGPVKSAPYELLVVCDKAWYESDAGKPFNDFVHTFMPGMPQNESIFRVICINEGTFTKTFMTFACIIFVNINHNKYKEPEYITARNLYARPQMVVTLNSPDYEGINQLIEEKGQHIIDLMVSNEMQRAIALLKKNHSGVVKKYAEDMFGYEWLMPSEITLIKKGKDFFWASSGDNTYNACMYSYPWTSNDTFTKDYFIHKRDSFMRKNIEGGEWGQYMQTNAEATVSGERMLDGHYVQEVHGLWEMKGDAMGGPFVSYVQLDSVKQRIVVTEGFVYLPNKEKKKMVHSLEAGLRTLRFLNEE